MPSGDVDLLSEVFRNQNRGYPLLQPRDHVLEKTVFFNPQCEGEASDGSEEIPYDGDLKPLGLFKEDGRRFPFSQFRDDRGNFVFRVKGF